MSDVDPSTLHPEHGGRVLLELATHQSRKGQSISANNPQFDRYAAMKVTHALTRARYAGQHLVAELQRRLLRSCAHPSFRERRV